MRKDVKIKICGLTTVEEAKYLNENQVDYAGMVLFFPKSKRNITVEQAGQILSALDCNIKTVAVTVSPTLEQALQIKKAGFSYLQVHGTLTEEVRKAGLPILKAFNGKDADTLRDYADCKEMVGYVFDAAEPGSGKTFDWKQMKDVPRDGKLFLLAGGLNPGNVKEAVKCVKPDGVDVSSGVEYEGRPGKDPKKITAFVDSVRKKKTGAKSLTEGKPMKLILLFALPVLLGNVFQLFYSLVDTKIVGQTLGTAPLSAVGSVSTLYDLLNGFINGLTLGFSLITARHFGSKNQKALKKSVADSIVMGSIVTCLIVVGVALFLKPIMNLLNVKEAQYDMAYSYILILVIGLFVTAVYNTCANLLRAIGDSVTPLIYLGLAAVGNIALDYLFILGFHMGVEGAGYATVLAQFLSVVLCLWRIRKHFPILHVGKEDFKGMKSRAVEMMQSGLSMGLMSCLVNFGTVALQTSINMLGTQIIVAHTAARKVCAIMGLPVMVLSASIATFAGQNYGARRFDRVKQGLKDTLLLGILWSGIVFIGTHLFAGMLISFLASTHDQTVIYWGSTYLKVDMSLFVICAFVCILRNAMQGFGDLVTPIVSSGVELVTKVVFAMVFVKMFDYWGIIWAEPVAWFLMVIPLIVMTIKSPVINEKIKSRTLEKRER